MITLIIFSIIWELGGGTADTIRNLTDSQMALFILIMVASDLNLFASRWR